MITGCGKSANTKSDNAKFMKEYESLNNTKAPYGDNEDYREISISEDNPFVYSSAKEIVNMIDNKETFYVYFGSAHCPWCRSVIEQAIKTANKNNIKKIYYVNIWKGFHEEILRDTYELDDNNEPKKAKDGTDEYYKLLDKFNDLLEDYTLTTEDNKNKDNKNEENNNDGTNERNKEKNKNNNNSNAYYFCINSEIVNLKNVKDETKINFTSLLKKIIQSEFGILNQSVNSNKDNDNNIGNSENSKSIEYVENSKSSENIENNESNENSKLQTLAEYLLGLTPVQFNKNDKLNGTQNANIKSADGKIIAQDKNQDGNDSSKIENEKNSENSKDGQNYNENNQNGEDNPIEQAEENVKTEVVSNNVNPRYNYDYNGIKIYNSTKYKLTNEMLDISNFSVNKDKILIYHTHTCESYTPTEKYNYQQTGNFRTTDLNFSVARVGEELKKQLESYNIKVIQNKTYHDYPSYNGSYSRSLTTANNMLNENKDADIVIDLHRDAIADSSYAPKVKIGDEYVSQMMFVIGTDIANSANSHWNENLKFAVKVQQKANEMYPRTI